MMYERGVPDIPKIPPAQSGGTFEIGLGDILGFARRRWLTVALGCLFGIVLGLGYVLSAEPIYSARSEVLLDTQKVEAFGRDDLFAEQSFGTSEVESQIRMLSSDQIAGDVVDRLGLLEREEFWDSPWNALTAGKSAITGAIRSVLSLVRPAPEEGPLDPEAEARRMRTLAIEKLQNNLSVARRGLSYVLTVGYNSTSPELAAEIANGVAEAYVDEQLNNRVSVAKRASDWFEDRLETLRQQVQAADNAVQEFRVANRMFSTGRSSLDEQRLGELTTELSKASADVAELRAQVEQFERAAERGEAAGLSSNTPDNEIIVGLREQYYDLTRQEADLIGRYGEDHITVVRLRQQMEQLRDAIDTESTRLAANTKRAYEVALRRQTSLQESLDGLLDNASVSSQSTAEFRELESKASSVRAIYESLLTRYAVSVQQQSSPFASARLVSPAFVPLEKSGPNTKLFLAGSVVFGLMLGFGTAFARELMDDKVRTRRQVLNATALRTLSILPELRAGAPTSVNVPAKRRSINLFPFGSRSARVSTEKDEAERVIAPTGVMAVSIDEPFSPFAEGIRAIKTEIESADRQRPLKVVGLISSEPEEGKTTVAINLARLFGAHKKVLLIDADVRKPSLSDALVPSDAHGLIQVLERNARFHDALWSDDDSDVSFLPSGISKQTGGREGVPIPPMSKLLEEVRGRYDLVVLDLPPILAVVDARAMAHLIDAFVVVVGWGRTDTGTLAQALEPTEIAERSLGAVLNKVDVAKMGQYEVGQNTKVYGYHGYTHA